MAAKKKKRKKKKINFLILDVGCRFDSPQFTLLKQPGLKLHDEITFIFVLGNAYN